jgi:hypothetical protein
MKACVLKHLSEEEAAKFGEWALGKDYASIHYQNIPSRWNALHGDKLTLQATHIIEISVEKMIALYKQENEIKDATSSLCDL